MKKYCPRDEQINVRLCPSEERMIGMRFDIVSSYCSPNPAI